jgi:hypothetical protein
MIPVTDLTPEHQAYWDHAPITIFTAPEDPAGCVPCPGIVTRIIEDGRSFAVVRVAWKPDEIEIAHLAKGGTIWLSTWGGLPPHMLEVQAP